ncbi:ATP-binding protein [Clostridium butyricum]|uniref:hypothetical protein n=1 Tax=Clostridium butyricum TaxID=1492 RepID=UPI002ABE9BAE|nr:hypothetical protein [Clostridium butyricum]
MAKRKCKLLMSIVNARNTLNDIWTIRRKTEILREIENNGHDEGASYLNIDVEYEKNEGTDDEDKSGKLNLKFKHDGKAFENAEEIVNAFLCIGYTDKYDVGDKVIVGGKGIGNKYALDCKLLRIISICNGIRIIVTIINPIEQIESILNSGIDGNIEYEVVTESCEADDSVEVQVMDINYLDSLEFAHERLKQYICFFTIISSKITLNENFKVNLKGLERQKKDDGSYVISTREHYDEIKKGYLLEKVGEIREKYKEEIVYFDDLGEGFKGKYEDEYDEVKKLINIKTRDGKMCKIDFFIIQTTKDKVKEYLNPLLKVEKPVGVTKHHLWEFILREDGC